MKKLLLALLLIIGAANAYSQCGTGPRKQLFMTISLGTNGSLVNKGMRMNAYNVDLNFSTGGRLSAICSFEFADNHYKQDGAKLYLHNTGLAGGLSYTLVKKAEYKLQVVGKAGGTIGSADWKNNFYDASIRLAPGTKIGCSSLILGVGYRYAHSHTADVCDHGFVYGTVGIAL